jgi:chaperonin GroEL
MKYSKSQFNEKARKSLLKGAEEVYKAVSTTLGARGRNIVIHKEHHTKILHDGVKTANEINPENPFKNAGASIIKQAGQRQVESCGDGTTLAIILGYAIASEALRVVESGENPMSLKGGLEKGRDILIEKINEMSKPVKTKQEKIQVATVSSEDEELGKMVGETYHKAGIDAVITAEQVNSPDTFIDHQEGMQIDSGYKAEWFITNPKTMTATVSRAKILVTDYKLDNIHDLVPLINNLVENNERNLVVIGEDVEGNVLASLIANKAKGQLNTLAIKAPSFQTEKVLQDVSTVVGAKFVSKSAKADLKKLTSEDLGYAERVTSTKEATVVVEGGGKAKDVKERILSIKGQIKEESNDFEREKLRERLAKLTGGVYTVKVGGATEVEAEEKYERADDAIKATRVAIEDGIIPGGEVIFLNIREALEGEDYAYKILRRALEKPFNKLVENAGLNSGQLMERLFSPTLAHEVYEGVDVTTGGIVNMMNAGIIDPAKVATEAIKNAVSVAVALITSDAIIVEVEDEKK